MSKLKKFGIIVLSVPLLAALAYSSWCVSENYQTGDWSESCGTLFTNPHYRACKQRRVWIPRLWVVASQPLPSMSPPVEQTPDKPPPGYYEVPPPSHQYSWDEHGKPVGDVVVLRNCDKLGCDVYRNFIPAHEPKGFTPVPEFLPADELNRAIKNLSGTRCYDVKGEPVACSQTK
jgi:hypothetical protein